MQIRNLDRQDHRRAEGEQQARERCIDDLVHQETHEEYRPP
jgi:hypothetical protein